MSETPCIRVPSAYLAASILYVLMWPEDKSRLYEQTEGTDKLFPLPRYPCCLHCTCCNDTRIGV